MDGTPKSESQTTLTSEQAKELKALTIYIREHDGGIDSAAAVMREAWAMYLRGLDTIHQLTEKPGTEKMARQMETEHRKTVALLRQFLKHPPTLEDAARSWPEITGLSTGLRDAIVRDIVIQSLPRAKPATAVGRGGRTRG